MYIRAFMYDIVSILILKQTRRMTVVLSIFFRKKYQQDQLSILLHVDTASREKSAVFFPNIKRKPYADSSIEKPSKP